MTRVSRGASSALEAVRALMALLRPLPFDAAAIATLTGASEAQIAAHARLGTILVYQGHVVAVR